MKRALLFLVMLAASVTILRGLPPVALAKGGLPSVALAKGGAEPSLRLRSGTASKVELWLGPYMAESMAQMSLGWPGPGPVVTVVAPITLDGSNYCVQDNGGTSATTASCTLSSVTAGDLITCCWTGAANKFASVSDSTNGLYQVPLDAYNGSTYQAAGEAYFANSASGSISPTLTFSASSGHLAIGCQAWKSAKSSAPVDPAAITQLQSVTSNTANPTSGSTQSPTGNGELNVCLTRDYSQAATAGTNYTLIDSSATSYFYPEYWIQTTATAANCPYTASADMWIDTSVAYMPSSATSGVTPFTGVYEDLSSGCSSGSVPTTSCLGTSGPNVIPGSWSVSNSSGTLTATSSSPTGALANSVYVDGATYTGSNSWGLHYTTVGSSPGGYIRWSTSGSYNPMYLDFQFETGIPQSDTSGHWEDIGNIENTATSEAMTANLIANGSALYVRLECISSSGGTTYSDGSGGSPVTLPHQGDIAIATSTLYTLQFTKQTNGGGTYGYCTSGTGCNTLTVWQGGTNEGTIGCYAGTGSNPASIASIGIVGAETESSNGYTVDWGKIEIGTVTAPLP